MVHRNTYVNGPTVLAETWQVRARPTLFFAGQMSGVEGYVESAASGLLAGIERRGAGHGRSRSRRRRGRRRSARSPTTCRTPTRRTTSRRTSRSASWSRSRARRRTGRRARRRIAERALADLAAWVEARQAVRSAARVTRSSEGVPGVPRAEPQRVARTRCAPTRAISRSSSITSRRDRRRQAARSRRRGARSRRRSAAFSPSCTRAGSRGRRRRGSWPPIRTFLRYLRREELIDDDPGRAGRDAEARGAHAGAPLRRARWPRCSTAPRPTTPLGRRDRAILELFYASGLRLSELAGLDLDDVNLSARMVRVLGKGGKERLVPFNSTHGHGDPRRI